jgi:hypothetical protein
MDSLFLVLVRILSDAIESLSKQMKRNICIYERFSSLWREFYLFSYSVLSGVLWFWVCTGEVRGPQSVHITGWPFEISQYECCNSFFFEKSWLTLFHIRLLIIKSVSPVHCFPHFRKSFASFESHQAYSIFLHLIRLVSETRQVYSTNVMTLTVAIDFLREQPVQMRLYAYVPTTWRAYNINALFHGLFQ